MNEEQVESAIRAKGLTAPRLRNAREKIWALEGYRLRQRLHDQSAGGAINS